jgi:hypothetical protein
MAVSAHANKGFAQICMRTGLTWGGSWRTVICPKRFELDSDRTEHVAARRPAQLGGCVMKTRRLASAAALAVLAGTAHAQDLKFAPGEDARFNWDSFKAFDEATNLDGQTLNIFGPWRGEDQVLVESMLAYFSAASGVTVNYSSSEGYEQQIVIDAEAGSPPDVAVLPQPGLIGDLAAKGFVVPLGDASKQWLTDNYGAGASWARTGPSSCLPSPTRLT